MPTQRKRVVVAAVPVQVLSNEKQVSLQTTKVCYLLSSLSVDEATLDNLGC